MFKQEVHSQPTFLGGGAYSNSLPIGGVALAIMAYFMRVKNTEQRPSLRQQMIQLDPLGTLVFLPGVVCFLIALQWGGVQYAWSNGRIIALFVVAGVLILTFIGLQIWGQENATVPPRIIKQRSVAAGAVFSTCVGGVLVTLLYWIAIWFQALQPSAPAPSSDALATTFRQCILASSACPLALD